MMRVITTMASILLWIVTSNANAITADDLVAKNIAARGGMEKIKSIQSLKLTGKIRFGSRELNFVQLSKRPAMLRIEVSLQGLTNIQAYDGSAGWRVNPFRGRVDPEKVSGDDLKSLELQADLDGPLVDAKTKGHSIEYLGTEDVDGTEAYKLKIKLKNGDVRYVFLDPDYFLEIRVIDQTTVRGVLEESETDLGNYEQVEGVYFPFSYEVGSVGQPKGQKITFEKAEVNVDLNENLFHFPAGKNQ